jgi:hypothetical protein
MSVHRITYGAHSMFGPTTMARFDGVIELCSECCVAHEVRFLVRTYEQVANLSDGSKELNQELEGDEVSTRQPTNQIL